MTQPLGPDVSGFQTPNVLSVGDWLFAFVKLSEGTGASNRNFRQQWSDALRFFKRGVYHYARPHSSDGLHQANTFCDLAYAAGFKHGVDMWALDVEGLGNDVKALGNEAVTGPEWVAFINTFMGQAIARLGPIGFLYVGQYFFPADIGPLTHRYPWWLPNYGINDGAVHGLPFGVNPVLHQFTSANGLDKSIVHDMAAWQRLTDDPHGLFIPVPPTKEHRVLSVSGVPVLDKDHNPFIDLSDDHKSIVAFYCEPWAGGPQVVTANGISVFHLALGEVAQSIAPGANATGVLVRLTNNQSHVAATKPGMVIR